MGRMIRTLIQISFVFYSVTTQFWCVQAYLLVWHHQQQHYISKVPTKDPFGAHSTRNFFHCKTYIYNNVGTHRRISSTLNRSKIKSNGLQRLWYREIDQGDDKTDPSMFKVRTRLPKFGKWYPNEESSPWSSLHDQQQQSQKRDGINRLLIRALTLNQYIIFGIAIIITAIVIVAYSGEGLKTFTHFNSVLQWSGGTIDVYDLNVSIERLLVGIMSAMPLLFLSNQIEQSDQRQFANINFSTITMCLTLFGRRSTPPIDFLPSQYIQSTATRDFPISSTFEVAKQSLIMSFITGFCEETVFRRFVPAIISLVIYGTATTVPNRDIQHVLVPYLGQAILFGLGHIQPGNKLSENIIQVGLQVLNGLGFGLIYVMNDGDIVPCIVAHTTYDFVVFFKTWVDANNQIEYAEKKAIDFTSTAGNIAEEQELVGRIFIDTAKTKKNVADVYKVLKRMFYLFDIDQNETLSLSEVRKGLAYMSIERQIGSPPPVEVIDQLFQEVGNNSSSATSSEQRRLTFPDFVRLIALSRNIK